MKKYLQIYEGIKKDIVEGAYKTGTKLPSKRSLAELWGVSLVTVEHAYNLLIEEGYVNAMEKSGYFVAYQTGDYFLGEKKTGVSESANEYNFEFDYRIKPDNRFEYISYDIYSRTVRKVLSFFADEVFVKSPAFGNLRLRREISEYLLRSRNIKASYEQIIIGAGAEYLYQMIAITLGTDKIYGVETPGYRKIKEVYEAGGIKTDSLKLGKNGIISSQLEKTKARVLHITPYRSYPTGITASAGKKEEYLKWSRKNDGIIIEDDFESEFTPSRKSVDTLYSMDDEQRVIYVNTFTQTISPSVRMAYMIVPEKMLDLFNSKTGIFSCPVATLEQLVVAQLLSSGDFERHINRVRRKIRNLK